MWTCDIYFGDELCFIVVAVAVTFTVGVGVAVVLFCYTQLHSIFIKHPSHLSPKPYAKSISLYTFHVWSVRRAGWWLIHSSISSSVVFITFVHLFISHFAIRIFTEHSKLALYLSEILLFCVLLKHLLFCCWCNANGKWEILLNTFCDGAVENDENNLYDVHNKLPSTKLLSLLLQ